MSERPFERWEVYVEETAGEFSYPPTPDIAGAVRERLVEKPSRPILRRRLVWAAVAVVLIVAGLLAVPQVRAGLLEFMRIGAVQILLSEPTPTATVPSPTPSTEKSRGPLAPADATAAARPLPTSTRPTATPWPSPTPLTSVLDLAGETTLAAAREEVDFPIRLPAYPPDLGPPNRVFVQDLEGPAVILVWLEPEQPEQVRLSLHGLGPGAFVSKGPPQVIEETTVDGQRAVWTTGPYYVKSRAGYYGNKRLVEGHVLIWVEEDITYRLETDLSLGEAVRIAESLNH